MLINSAFLWAVLAFTTAKIPSHIQSFYEHTLVKHRPYEYMFDKEGAALRLAEGKEYGAYGGGMKGLFLYSGIKSGIALYLESKGNLVPEGDFYDLSIFSMLAQVNAFSDGKTSLNGWLSDDFLHYNPEFVEWGFANLIPKPKEKIGESTYQEVYNRVGRRFVHLLVETRLALQGVGQEQESLSYQEGMNSPNFDVYEWVSERESTLSPLNDDFGGYWVSFHAETAYSWWVRRTIDGSDDSLWKGILRMVKKYERPYFNTVKRRLRAIERGR